MSLPKTFKAAVYTDAQSGLKLEERPLQMPGKGQLLVKVLACGVCHSDVGTPYFAPLPVIPGHEIIGDIVAVGADVIQWKVGDRVGSGWHGGHCQICAECTSGNFQTCDKQNVNGVHSDGGMAEYVILRAEALASVPKHLDPAEAAPLLCAGLTTYNSLRKMNVRPGETVAIQGIGGLGHMAIQFAHKMGFRTVALSSSDQKRSEAMELGANDYIDGSKEDQGLALQKMGGAKVIICTAPDSSVIHQLIPGLATKGTLLLIAIIQNLTLPDNLNMIQKQLSLTGFASGTARDSEDTIAFAEMQGIKCLVERFRLDEIDTAFEKMKSGKVRFRSVIVFD